MAMEEESDDDERRAYVLGSPGPPTPPSPSPMPQTKTQRAGPGYRWQKKYTHTPRREIVPENLLDGGLTFPFPRPPSPSLPRSLLHTNKAYACFLAPLSLPRWVSIIHPPFFSSIVLITYLSPSLPPFFPQTTQTDSPIACPLPLGSCCCFRFWFP